MCCWGHCPCPLSTERSLIYYAEAHAVIQVSFPQSQSIICCSLVTHNTSTLPHPPSAQCILEPVLLLALPISPSLRITLHKCFVETLVLKSRLIVIQLEQSTGPCSWIIIDTKGLSAGDLGERDSFGISSPFGNRFFKALSVMYSVHCCWRTDTLSSLLLFKLNPIAHLNRYHSSHPRNPWCCLSLEVKYSCKIPLSCFWKGVLFKTNSKHVEVTTSHPRCLQPVAHRMSKDFLQQMRLLLSTLLNCEKQKEMEAAADRVGLLCEFSADSRHWIWEWKTWRLVEMCSETSRLKWKKRQTALVHYTLYAHQVKMI